MSVDIDLDRIRGFLAHALQGWQREMPDGQTTVGEFAVSWNCTDAENYSLTHFTIGDMEQVESADPDISHTICAAVALYVKPKGGLFVAISKRQYRVTVFEDKRVLVQESPT